MKYYLLLCLILRISSAFTGIDVSKWQGYITWTSVAQNNHFAILRAGYGIGHTDDYFETNYKNAKVAGVKVGAYWYSLARSESDAVQEANSIMSLLAGKQFEWPIYYDIEESSIFAAGIESAIAKAFCHTLEANKFYCGIYSSASLLNNFFDHEVKTAFSIWVSHRDVDVPSYHG